MSAQISDSGAADEKDKVVVQASTVTDEEGSYTIFLEPGTYNIVGHKDGYDPACAQIDAVSGAAYTEEFALSDALTGTMTGNVSIDDDDEKYVTVSIRQSAECSGSIDQIEVKSLNVANGGSYDISLPEGTYSVVASTYNKETQVYDDVDIVTNTVTTINIVF